MTTQPRRSSVRGTARAALLGAAQELFGQYGYAATTTRAIGESAGVDPTLIARYFGSKEALYMATLDDTPLPAGATDLASFVTRVLDRTQRVGPSPISRAAVVGSSEPATERHVAELLQQRLVGPLHAHFSATGATDPALRAEIAVAATFGIALARATGLLRELADADQIALIELTIALVSSLDNVRA